MDKRKPRLKSSLQRIYQLLFDCYGPQHWWPGDGPFETMVGAILTQSTAWGNVEKAIRNLREANVLRPITLREMSEDRIAELIRPSGYYSAKARKLKALVTWLGSYDDNLPRIFAREVKSLRSELLGVYGIGEETADSILLYAAEKPVFVIDAYTRRIMDRIGHSPVKKDYGGYQYLFSTLAIDAAYFNEYHALLVQHGKSRCRKVPLCSGCCLLGLCREGLTRTGQS